jgi:hypothetical protein
LVDFCGFGRKEVVPQPEAIPHSRVGFGNANWMGFRGVEQIKILISKLDFFFIILHLWVRASSSALLDRPPIYEKIT